MNFCFLCKIYRPVKSFCTTFALAFGNKKQKEKKQKNKKERNNAVPPVGWWHPDGVDFLRLTA